MGGHPRWLLGEPANDPVEALPFVVRDPHQPEHLARRFGHFRTRVHEVTFNHAARVGILPLQHELDGCICRIEEICVRATVEPLRELGPARRVGRDALSSGPCQVNVARTGFASDEIATQTLDLDTRRLTPDPEGTFA